MSSPLQTLVALTHPGRMGNCGSFFSALSDAERDMLGPTCRRYFDLLVLNAIRP